ncbi:MAG: hypothetical protein GX036_07230 [Firmicutes bacterium]|nr:hypothetical protein [Bacillota bacterium]
MRSYRRVQASRPGWKSGLRLLLGIGLLVNLWCHPPLLAQEKWYPFILPWDDATPTIVDASYLLVDYPGQDPATVIDSRGHVYAGDDGHFYFSKTGRRAKFWGVNFTFGANFPPKDRAEKVAARLAKLGVNVVRFHHMDYHAAPQGIWDPRYFPRDTQHLDRGQLDRWDYLVYQLKRHGIYVNINLKVARHFGPDDGLPNTHLFTENRFFRGVSHYNQRMIALQKDYAAQLLARKNPYTGLTYAEDPVVFCVEITNEDSLFGSLLTDGEINYIPGKKDVLSEEYSRELDTLWNQWLKEKYGTDEKLIAAWDPGLPPPDVTNRVRNNDFTKGKAEWQAQALERARMTWEIKENAGPGGSPAAEIRVTPDGIDWHVQLMQGGHALVEGQRYEISFWAKARRPGKINLSMMKGAPPWQNYGLNKEFSLDSDWRQYRASFMANATEEKEARITFNLGDSSNTIWISQVEFKETVPVILDLGESMALGNIGRPLRSDFGRYTDNRLLDLLRFYYELDKAYFTEMRRYLKEELGVKALVTGTAPWWAFLGDIAAQSGMDFIDSHYYWDHPWWPAVPAWSPRGWIIHNTPQINSMDQLCRLAAMAVAGKPFTLSEYNQSFPNRYAHEAPLLIAAFAAFQDWDAVYLFDYAGSAEDFSNKHTTSFFALCGNPVKTAQLPIASRIFLGGQIEPARSSIDLALNLDEVFTGYTKKLTEADYFLAAHGFDRANALIHRLRITSFAAPPGGDLSRPVPEERVVSDHQQLIWDRSDPARAFLELRGPAVTGAVGFLQGRTFTFPGWSFHLDAKSPDHCAVLLQPAGGRRPVTEGVPASSGLPEPPGLPGPLLAQASENFLLTVWSEHRNTGMLWNKSQNSVEDRWGQAPPRIRPVLLSVEFQVPEGASLRLFALDPTGARKKEIKGKPGAGGIWEFPIDTGREKTFWFEGEILKE